MIARTMMGLMLTLSCLLGAAATMTTSPVAQAQEPAQRTRVVTFRITGMMTPTCPVLVETAVRRIEGVEHVQASLESRTAVVRYRVGRTSPEAIQRVIHDQAGFDAEIVNR